MSDATLIYPHQLFSAHPSNKKSRPVYLIEDPLFFRQYNFHAKKLAYHRATMIRYQADLEQRGYRVSYVEAKELDKSSDIAKILKKDGIDEVYVAAVTDDYLSKGIRHACKTLGASLEIDESPGFLTPKDWANEFFEKQGKYYFTKFYIEQRKRLSVLLNKDGSPSGGKWTFDTENRKKLPKGYEVSALPTVQKTEDIQEACTYVRKQFPDALGDGESLEYPISRRSALRWLDDFLSTRFKEFGDYEDAIAQDEAFINHSVLTPMLNAGIITPKEVYERALEAGVEYDIPINSLEGFIRQVIGWREYMRMVYLREGRFQRTNNFWGHSRRIPASFYDGTTGIEPVDTIIKRTLRHAYAHHIERLMILGNIMLLCEFDPDDIYRWFMELYIDAYDWVMVPNVYGMSQYADGGLITTKPYISSSNYVRKMSDFSSGAWCETWDGLYWRFIDKHQDFFSKNARLKMMTSHLGRMSNEKLAGHKKSAKTFITSLAA